MRAPKIVTSSSLAVFLLGAAASSAACSGGGVAGPTDPDAGDSGSDGGNVTCPSDLPSMCPAQPPSYKTDIAPILAVRCFPCHQPGGVEGTTRNYSTYAVVSAQQQSMESQTYQCRMPPGDSPAPTPQERALLLAWLVCGAPNN